MAAAFDHSTPRAHGVQRDRAKIQGQSNVKDFTLELSKVGYQHDRRPAQYAQYPTIPPDPTRRCRLRHIYRGEFVMKTLITALAVTAILATSAVAKTERTRAAHIQHNNGVSHNSVSHNSETQLNASYCRFHNGETDPDPGVRLLLVRDCKNYQESE
jgi:hypothetical protein